MAYVCVDKDGSEMLFAKLPIREIVHWAALNNNRYVVLPKGSIKALLGFALTWDDDAVELTEDLLKRD